jgi:hypothetical protein
MLRSGANAPVCSRACERETEQTHAVALRLPREQTQAVALRLPRQRRRARLRGRRPRSQRGCRCRSLANGLVSRPGRVVVDRGVAARQDFHVPAVLRLAAREDVPQGGGCVVEMCVASHWSGAHGATLRRRCPRTTAGALLRPGRSGRETGPQRGSSWGVLGARTSSNEAFRVRSGRVNRLCRRFTDSRSRPENHGKEGVAGSSPAEGSRESPAQAGLFFARRRRCRRPWLKGGTRGEHGALFGARTWKSVARQRASRQGSSCTAPGLLAHSIDPRRLRSRRRLPAAASRGVRCESSGSRVRDGQSPGVRVRPEFALCARAMRPARARLRSRGLP